MNTLHIEELQFAVCLNNEGYPASLEIGKLYPIIPDKEAAEHGYLRVIDESGEDYAFEAGRFVVVDLPIAARKTLASVAAL
jgi:hypothetical protein